MKRVKELGESGESFGLSKDRLCRAPVAINIRRCRLDDKAASPPPSFQDVEEAAGNLLQSLICFS